MNNTIKIIIACIGAVVIMAAGASAAVSNSSRKIVLVPENTVVLDMEVNENTVSKAIEGILTNPGKDINLYIKSPGGSVIAGTRLVNILNNTDKKVTCIADIAISMAFVIFQACDTRLVTDNAIVMQHVPSYEMDRTPVPNAESMTAFLNKVIDENDKMQARKIGLSLEVFHKKIRNDWWLFGSQAIKENVADGSVKVSCSADLLKQERTTQIATPFGMLQLVFNGCPLIDSPKSIGRPTGMSDTDFSKILLDLNTRNNILMNKK